MRRTVGSKKAREREYARRRYAKQVVRLNKAHQRRRRNQMVGLITAAALIVGGVTVGFLATRPGDSSPAAEPTMPEPIPCTRPTPLELSFDAPPSPDVAEGRKWTGTMDLCQDGSYGSLGEPVVGTLQIELDGQVAPQAVASFVFLTQAGFFDGLTCHRLAESISVLQCGDPDGTGGGGPGYAFGPIENAPEGDLYPAGTIAMARVSGDGTSMGSQFFILYADAKITSDAAGGYTVFGRVTSGLDVVQMIAAMGTVGAETPAAQVTIQKVEIQ